MVQIRDVQESDKAFIYATMLRGLYYGSEYWNKTPKREFFKHYQAVVDSIMQHSEIRIACLPDDADVILGYTIQEGPCLHWAFVKEGARNNKIAVKLLADTQKITCVSHLTKLGESIRLSKGWNFEPWRAK